VFGRGGTLPGESFLVSIAPVFIFLRFAHTPIARPSPPDRLHTGERSFNIYCSCRLSSSFVLEVEQRASLIAPPRSIALFRDLFVVCPGSRFSPPRYYFAYRQQPSCVIQTRCESISTLLKVRSTTSSWTVPFSPAAGSFAGRATGPAQFWWGMNTVRTPLALFPLLQDFLPLKSSLRHALMGAAQSAQPVRFPVCPPTPFGGLAVFVFSPPFCLWQAVGLRMVDGRSRLAQTEV